MTIRETFDSIYREQGSFVARPVMENRRTLVETLLTDAFRAIISRSPELAKYKVQGSNGKGNNARVPWVRVYDPEQSASPTSGWHVVQLFSADGSKSYLSLNLGVTNLTSKEIDGQVEIAKALLPKGISDEPGTVARIELKDANLGRLYEFGNIVAFEFLPGQVVLDDEFEQKLKWMLSLLSQLPFVEPKIKETKMATEPLENDELSTLEEETGWDRDQLLPILESLFDASPQIVLTGPPGTGKTHIARALARYLVSKDGFVDPDSLIKIVQFHPSYGYEEFVEGLRPVPSIGGGIEFQNVPGLIVNLAASIENDGLPRVLIIDEMNRANLPKVFGELMFLLEYRNQAISLALTESFKLPEKLFMIGTLNTADRSVQGLDLALRRRFDFFEVAPDVDILKLHYKKAGNSNELKDKLFSGFEKLNEAILIAVGDRHLQIGHSYFMRKTMKRDDLKKVWDQQLAPLLEEYFFDSPETAASFKFDDYWPA